MQPQQPLFPASAVPPFGNASIRPPERSFARAGAIVPSFPPGRLGWQWSFGPGFRQPAREAT